MAVGYGIIGVVVGVFATIFFQRKESMRPMKRYNPFERHGTRESVTSTPDGTSGAIDANEATPTTNKTDPPPVFEGR